MFSADADDTCAFFTVSRCCLSKEGLVFLVEGQGMRAIAKWWRALLWGLPNEDAIYLHGTSPSAQTRCLLWVHERDGQEAMVSVSAGKKERKIFPLRASCYYSASGAEQREMSVLCLWDPTQNMYTHSYWHTHTHTLKKTGSSISMR